MIRQAQISMRRYTSGLTLVEVLIAATVIAIGLLGVASLQINALQSENDAQNRATATDVIAALADRVRANLNGVAEYANNIDGCTAAPTICAMIPDGSVDDVSECTPEEMAAYDLWELNCNLDNAIPGAQLSVTCPAGCDQLNDMTLSVSWQTQNRNPTEGTQAAATTVTHEVVATILPGAVE